MHIPRQLTKQQQGLPNRGKAGWYFGPVAGCRLFIVDVAVRRRQHLETDAERAARTSRGKNQTLDMTIGKSKISTVEILNWLMLIWSYRRRRQSSGHVTFMDHLSSPVLSYVHVSLITEARRWLLSTMLSSPRRPHPSLVVVQQQFSSSLVAVKSQSSCGCVVARQLLMLLSGSS